MNTLHCTAARLADGRTVPLAAALEVELTATLDSPAELLRGRFAVGGAPGRLGEVRAHAAGGISFAGAVDRQTLTVSGSGTVLALEARSKGALLLDNEALPCALTNASVGTVFSLFIKPYGFSLHNTNAPVTLPVYTVRKGASEWDALRGFTQRAWGLTPCVRGERVLLGRAQESGTLTISNTGRGVPFVSATDEFIPYNMLSRVYLRDARGRYSSSVANADAPYYRIARKRYFIPQNEFMDRAVPDANRRIADSMRDSVRVEAVLPGLVYAQPGMAAEIVDNALVRRNLLVQERRYVQSASGVFTRLLLADATSGLLRLEPEAQAENEKNGS